LAGVFPFCAARRQVFSAKPPGREAGQGREDAITDGIDCFPRPHRDGYLRRSTTPGEIPQLRERLIQAVGKAPATLTVPMSHPTGNLVSVNFFRFWRSIWIVTSAVAVIVTTSAHALDLSPRRAIRLSHGTGRKEMRFGLLPFSNLSLEVIEEADWMSDRGP